jgi:hypothetical protein
MSSSKPIAFGLALLAGITASACGRDEAGNEAEAAPMPMQEFMVHVIAYNANNLWKWQGWSQGPEGETSLFPKTDEEWEMAESAGLSLSELSNLLLLPGRRLEDDKWQPYVLGMRKAAGDAAAAAEQHNPDALFEASGRLQEACAACHYHYAPHLEPPPLKVDAPPAQANSQSAK